MSLSSNVVGLKCLCIFRRSGLGVHLSTIISGFVRVDPVCGFVQVKIMRPHDPAGKIGPKKPLPDVVVIHEPKEEEVPAEKGYMKEEDMY